jgi:hypothetical protein
MVEMGGKKTNKVEKFLKQVCALKNKGVVNKKKRVKWVFINRLLTFLSCFL